MAKAKKAVSKKKKSGKPKKAARKAAPKRKAKKPGKKATKKTKGKAKAATRTASKAKKTKARKAAPAARKAAPAKKKKQQTVGEGDYQASRRFLKDQAGFVSRNSDKIPAMGQAAERALDGPQGDELRAAEAAARAHAKAGGQE